MKDSPADFMRFLRGLGLGMHGMSGMSNQELERQRQMWAQQQSPFAQGQAQAQSSYYDALRGMGGNFGQGVAAPPPKTRCSHGVACIECKLIETIQKQAKREAAKARQEARKAQPEPVAVPPEQYDEEEVSRSLMDDEAQWEEPVEPEPIFPGWFSGFLVALVVAWVIAGILWL